MFENYPTYARQVLGAARKMSAGKKAIGTKVLVGTVAAGLAGAGAFAASGNAIEMMQVSQAIESVSGDLPSAPMEVKVETDGTTLAELLGDENGLSASEQVQIAEQIKASIATEDLSNATGRMLDENTAEITISTLEGIPVTVTVVKNDEGIYKIESVVAQLDKTAAAAQKENVNNPNSTDGQKTANAKPLPAFDTTAFDAAIGLAADASDEDALGAYARQMSVLADGLVMAVPEGFEAQEVEQPEDADAGKEDSDKKDSDKDAKKGNAEEGEGEPANASPEVPGENGEDAAEAAMAEAAAATGQEKPAFKPYNRSWKTSDGSSISVRAENLGEAFSQMNGLDAVNKMMGYWQETAESVANGAGQSMKDPDAGFATEIFFDEETGLWGYWGTVSFTDGSRDILYDRMVVIDEITDQMITVSYRHDGVVDAGGGLALDDYKKLFCHGVAEGGSGHVGAAWSTYQEKLKEIGLGDREQAKKEESAQKETKVELTGE